MIVLNIENINLLFFRLLEAAFKIHLAQKSEGAEWGGGGVMPIHLTLNGHDASGSNNTDDLKAQ